MRIPNAPEELRLSITRLWNGGSCPVVGLSAEASVRWEENGDLTFRGRMPILAGEHTPIAPIGTRVDKLWEYDVVELFMAENSEKYVEIEVGSGGHFLVFSFEGARRRTHEHAELRPLIRHERSATHWETEIRVPAHILPSRVGALNAYAAAHGQYLAYQPVPGTQPDFHQPDAFAVLE